MDAQSSSLQFQSKVVLRRLAGSTAPLLPPAIECFIRIHRKHSGAV